MRFFYTFILSIFILFALSLSAIAQDQAKEKAAPKIAFVHTRLFADEKEGIQIYVKALNELNKEFKPFEDEFKVMAEKINKLADEIERSGKYPLSCNTKFIEQKLNEHEKLVIANNSKSESVSVLYQKRRDEVIKPVEDDINKELIEFAKQRGFKFIMDISDPAVIIEQPIVPDITKEFIAYYNAKHAVTNSQTQVKLSEIRF